jgi:hypothetical protein
MLSLISSIYVAKSLQFKLHTKYFFSALIPCGLGNSRACLSILGCFNDASPPLVALPIDSAFDKDLRLPSHHTCTQGFQSTIGCTLHRHKIRTAKKLTFFSKRISLDISKYFLVLPDQPALLIVLNTMQ